ncbi:disease resistance protein [Striga asiatica]|uniref:Disease resistance protein n=1 Tax=Striga asiatica TaxID=4170 RepID=A0A5A7PNE9_STRAF|nr:disease resistance protein [Striga asiatica]
MSPSRNIITLTIVLPFFFLILSSTKAQTNNQTISPNPLPNPNPYETVNNFCLHKRLNVAKPFCLRVLKNPNAANAKTNDLNPLLQVAINSTSSFVNRTLNQLLDMSEDLTTKPDLIPAIDSCLASYENIAEYIKNVLLDASQESTIAGLDGEVIVEYINGCIKAVARTNDPDIGDWNNEAKSYAKLLIDIADGLTSKEAK